MAVDTAPKRKSMLAFGAYARPVIQHPDATLPQGWRQTWLWGYFGIDWEEPAGARVVEHGSDYVRAVDSDVKPAADAGVRAVDGSVRAR